MSEFKDYALGFGKRAREVSYDLATRSTGEKNNALLKMAESIADQSKVIQEENKKDIEFARSIGKSEAIIDRLILNDTRIEGMTKAIRDIIALPDPVGKGSTLRTLQNGLRLRKVSVPIGVVGFIYESRPNVTSDAAALCLKSGNTVILRGGKEAVHSNTTIAKAVRDALSTVNFPADCVQMIDRTEHEIVSELLALDQYLDVVIPRGGKGLINVVTSQSRVPVIYHDEGICHVYLDESADQKSAVDISVNAKVQRPSVCNAIETLLIHENFPHKTEVLKALKENKVELRGDDEIRKIYDMKPATDEDWSTEYLDLILSVKMVKSTKEAVDHINRYGSHHSDAIVSESYKSCEYFLSHVDSAAVYANASTRFTDGGEFGLGAEIGISTQKLHVRGPMGLDGLTSEKWVIYGDGHIR